ncbi:HDIG domain-containing metalloprotein [Alteromonas sp. CYL-A6]|uniref:HDIG domain-containing metalloprotein n=1 Tax=Alteromonas nitratireducens TaxID=3390813 RepID=UPI0034B67E22
MMNHKDDISKQPMLTRVNELNRFIGKYVITRVRHGYDAKKRKFTTLTLSDASAVIQVYCDYARYLEAAVTPSYPAFVEVTLLQNGNVYCFWCKYLERCEYGSAIGNHLSAIPLDLCQSPSSLADLVDLYEQITDCYLREFLTSVLLQPEVCHKFIQCPASINYHHNYPGGLLAHSVETAKILANECFFGTIDKQVAIVAGLLHDIGKTQTLSPDIQRTQIGKLVDHGQLTLEICAVQLKRLSEQSPYFANQLRHAWTCYSPNARFGFKPQTAVARALQYADKRSADGALHRPYRLTS